MKVLLKVGNNSSAKFKQNSKALCEGYFQVVNDNIALKFSVGWYKMLDTVSLSETSILISITNQITEICVLLCLDKLDN